jgi:hypothetical protein
LKKRSKKTFAPAGFGRLVTEPPGTGSFLLLFFKKEALSL